MRRLLCDVPLSILCLCVCVVSCHCIYSASPLTDASPSRGRQVSCFTYEGIDAVKEALLKGEQCSNGDSSVKIRLIAPPMYVVTCMTLDKELGIELLNQAIALITETIKEKG